ncbi:MAG: alpha,alpha-trehalase TreA [Ginsengibacter sp.]
MAVKDFFSLGELFERVQMENIFPDGKTFVDCTPLSALSSIHALYEGQKHEPWFDLATFVHNNFILPKSHSTEYTSVTGRPIVEHIEMLWDELKRQPEEEKSSLIPLPHPYIVPGGRFREIYYWDSYFTMLGLQASGKIDMIQNMVDNFSFLIDKFGYIPNGNRTYFLGRSQPPFYASMVKLLSEEKGENILVDYLSQLEKEYNFWMRGTEELDSKNPYVYRVILMQDESVLNRYWDEHDTPREESFKEDVELAKDVSDKKILFRNIRAACESGWDFSSRWFKNEKDFKSIHTTEIIPIDLNCLLFDLEKTIAKAYQLSNNNESAEKYITAANKRKEAIQKYFWNKEQASYFDYDYVEGKQKQSQTLAATFPLFFKIATEEQAEGISKFLRHFFHAGGLLTTTVTTSQQWDSPNGWAPLQWIAIKGLINYGFSELAYDIAQRWMSINEKVYNNIGKMMEKYNVVATDLEAGGGEYLSQDGFGWTNGVYLKLHSLSTDVSKL